MYWDISLLQGREGKGREEGGGGGGGARAKNAFQARNKGRDQGVEHTQRHSQSQAEVVLGRKEGEGKGLGG